MKRADTTTPRAHIHRGGKTGKASARPSAPSMVSAIPAIRQRQDVDAEGDALPTAAQAAVTAALTSTGSKSSRPWLDQGEITNCASVRVLSSADLKNSSNRPTRRNSGGGPRRPPGPAPPAQAPLCPTGV